MKLVAGDVLGLVLSYLRNCGYEKIAKYLKKHANYEEDEANPISKLSLMKIVKAYLLANPEVKKSIKKYKKQGIKKREIASAEMEEEKVQEKNEEAEIVAAYAPEKKKLKQSDIKEEQMNEEVPEVQEEEKSEPAPEQAIEPEPVQEEVAPEEEEVREKAIDRSPSKTQKPNKAVPYKRIDENILSDLRPELRDNSFGGKFKNGLGDYYGVEGHEKLKDKAGKGFRKEKSKFKNKNFQGGNGGKITYGVNSTKL